MNCVEALIGSLVLSAAGCSQSDDAAQAELSPEQSLASLESRLLSADDFRMRYTARATGAFNVDLTGAFRHQGNGIVRLTGSGTFGDQPVDLRLSSADGNMTGGNPAGSIDQPTPPALTSALVLGLTRMGILHNLARLTAGQPPDHAEGGVEDWIRAVDVRYVSDQAPPPDAATGLGFGLEVEGQKSAEVLLWLDADGLPILRTQEVSFPGGTMHVVEEYQMLRLEP